MKLARLALAALLVLSVTAADGGCRRVESDRPPSERRADPRRQRVVVMRVAEATGPYEVTVQAAEVGQRLADVYNEIVPQGPYRQTLNYTSGISIEVHMRVAGHANDRFGCVIEDGPDNVARDYGNGLVLCTLVTQR